MMKHLKAPSFATGSGRNGAPPFVVRGVFDKRPVPGWQSVTLEVLPANFESYVKVWTFVLTKVHVRVNESANQAEKLHFYVHNIS